MDRVQPGRSPAAPVIETPVPREATRLSELSSQQWRSGIAAWLGWLFDGLDMHLYTLVATPFVAQLLLVRDVKDPAVGYYSSIIQASFLVGWALGGGLFGRLGDRLGRAHALMLTILTYALFTGLSFFAQTWWHLLICRFLAALGIGGEWAVGAALLAETWPRQWRPWIAATLQTAVNMGVLLAMLAGLLLSLIPYADPYWEYRTVFLVGIVPALLVVWIRWAVPEPEQWAHAKASTEATPGIADLFRGAVRRTTLLTILVCALGLSAHWAFMFWSLQHLRNHPDVADWSDAAKTQWAGAAMIVLMVSSIAGNYLSAAVARRLGYRMTIALGCLAYFAAMWGAYGRPWGHVVQFTWLIAIGACAGIFGLFTMYLPPLFPVLLRTTGAGFCYNIGRIAAAVATVVFGLFSHVGDHRLALFYASYLFLPAAWFAFKLPELRDGE